LTKPKDVIIGPLTQYIFNGASWKDIDNFPSNQMWADNVECVLSHLKSHNQLERFLPMLRGKLTQRDSALAEARTSYFFSNKGFKIISWEPAGDSNSLGEFEIQWESTTPIFVEVKGPRWEGELNQNERNHRKQEGKYKNGEVRSLDTIGKVTKAIEKAVTQRKFAEGKPNLLVVSTSNLFVSPTELSKKIVGPKVQAAMKSFNSLSGVLMHDVICKGGFIDYGTFFVKNCNADNSSKLSLTVERLLLSANKTM